MACNHVSEGKGRTPSEELSSLCSDALDLGAELYGNLVRARDFALGVCGRDPVELEHAVTEQGSVLVHLANEVTDGSDLEKIREELSRRHLPDVI